MQSLIAMQVGDYFKKAYDSSQTNNDLKKFDGGRFAGVLGYHAGYFQAMAYYTLLEAQFKEA